MTPFLLPFVLLLYGEFSRYEEVRYTSRMLLYGYSGSIIASMYMVEPMYAGILSCGLLFVTMFYVSVTSTVNWLSSILILPISLLLLNYTVVYFQPQDLIQSLPEWYLEYSHRITREMWIIMIQGLSWWFGGRDDKLNYTIGLLYATEQTIMRI